mgnify:CR=1 FL=1
MKVFVQKFVLEKIWGKVSDMATMIAKIELSIPEKTNLSFYDSIDMAKDEMENKIHNAISEGELRSIISITWEEK